MKMISHMAWTEEGSRIVLKISQKSEIGDLVVQIATGHSNSFSSSSWSKAQSDNGIHHVYQGTWLEKMSDLDSSEYGS